jgi:hypothetical protein
MLTLAMSDPWRHTRREVIEAMLEEIDKVLLREIQVLRELRPL